MNSPFAAYQNYTASSISLADSIDLLMSYKSKYYFSYKSYEIKEEKEESKEKENKLKKNLINYNKNIEL